MRISSEDRERSAIHAHVTRFGEYMCKEFESNVHKGNIDGCRFLTSEACFNAVMYHVAKAIAAKKEGRVADAQEHIVDIANCALQTLESYNQEVETCQYKPEGLIRKVPVFEY